MDQIQMRARATLWSYPLCAFTESGVHIDELDAAISILKVKFVLRHHI
jgi:hypothetical protein